MSIITNKRKKGITYTAVVRKGQYRTRPLRKTFPTKGEAIFWKAKQEQLLDMKKHRDPRLAEHVTLSDALEKYAHYGKNILKKAPTSLDREIYSRKHLEDLLGADTPLSKITPPAITEYQNARLAEQASASSIRLELAMLSRMFRIARNAWQLPVENPMDRVDRIPPDKGRLRFLSDHEAALVIAETQNSHNKKFYPFVLLLMHTGMRTGEAARLTTDAVDLDRRLLTIHETKIDQPRTIGISHTVVEVLQTIDIEQDGYFFLKPSHRAAWRIMLRPGHIFRGCWQSLWHRLEQKHRNDPEFPLITHFRPHDIRHTAASHLLRQGIDIRIIADILGHSTLQMVMRYTHLFDDSKTEYADKISYLGTEKEKTDE